jgi:hypothetical protein
MIRTLITVLAAALAVALGACTHVDPEPPALPVLVAAPAAPPVPLLPYACEADPLAAPVLPDRDINRAEAARDRRAVKSWGTAERSLRLQCRAALKTHGLLPLPVSTASAPTAPELTLP